MDRGTATENGGPDGGIDTPVVDSLLAAELSDLSLNTQIRGDSSSTSTPSPLFSNFELPELHETETVRLDLSQITPLVGALSKPQTPTSDQETGSPASTTSNSSKGVKPCRRYICMEEGCTNRKVFTRASELRCVPLFPSLYLFSFFPSVFPTGSLTFAALPLDNKVHGRRN